MHLTLTLALTGQEEPFLRRNHGDLQHRAAVGHCVRGGSPGGKGRRQHVCRSLFYHLSLHMVQCFVHSGEEGARLYVDV